MQEIATYAPIRIALTGLWRVAFGGALVWLAAVGALHTFPHGPRSATDPSLLVSVLMPLGFSLVGLMIALPGIGRIASAFSRDCYLRGGPAGISVRIPMRGWFGRFRVRAFHFGWDEIDRLVDFTYRINGIPTSHELRIHLRNGSRLKIEGSFFSLSPAAIQSLLLAMQPRAGVVV